MGPKGKTSAQMGIWARAGAVSFMRATKGKNAGDTALLRERAYKLLHGYRDFFLPSQRASAAILAQRIYNKIGYVKLSVVTGHKKASIQVDGAAYRKRGQGTISWNLLPGKYTVIVRYPGKNPQARQLKLSPKQAQLVTFRAPKQLATRRISPRPKLPTPKPNRGPLVGGILLGVGGAIAVSGGVLLITRFAVTEPSIDANMSQAQSTGDASFTRAANAAYASAITQNTAGWILLGSGAAVAVVGGLVFALAGKSN